MKRIAAISLLVMIVLAACSVNENNNADNEKNGLEASWSEIEELAKGKEAHLFMWGGDAGINAYIDEWVAPKLKEQYNVTLVRHPMDTAEFINKLTTEKQAKKENGTIDMIWINGENFKNAKENELLVGSFANKLPNIKTYINHDASYLHDDMGTAIEGMEAPWGKVQFVFIYDEANVQNPPRSLNELKSWTKENPGQFTYPNVNDFTGNAFVRHLLYDTAGSEEALTKEWLDQNGSNVWKELNEWEASLWRSGETYPESLAQLDQLFAKGEISFTMGFNERRAESLIQEGVFPKTTKTVVLEPGSIGNAHYLSIPFNSPNKEAAMTAINFMLSPEAQIAKLDPSMWGEGMVVDPTKLSNEEQKAAAEMQGGSSMLPAEELQKAYLPDLHADYANWIKENWENEVVQN
jgi:putative spermidine/putrescine transport system substrate-binding protein